MRPQPQEGMVWIQVGEQWIQIPDAGYHPEGVPVPVPVEEAPEPSPADGGGGLAVVVVVLAILAMVR